MYLAEKGKQMDHQNSNEKDKSYGLIGFICLAVSIPYEQFTAELCYICK